MNVNLPKPPTGSVRFLYDLVAQLTNIFRKIRPASGWKDKEAPLHSAKISGSQPPSWDQYIDGIYAYSFSASQLREIWITFHLPHDMALTYKNPDGTISPPKLFPHFHWSTGAGGTDTGDVRFGIEWTYAQGYNTAAFGTSQTIYLSDAGSGTAYQHMITEVSDDNAISSADFEVDGILLMRVFRDGAHASDTLSDKIFIFTVDMHYLSDGYNTIERNRNTGTIPWTKQAVL